MMCLMFFRRFYREKMKMTRDNSLTFEQGCELYLNNCRERNLRQGKINHYRQSYEQFYNFFDRNKTPHHLSLFSFQSINDNSVYKHLFINKANCKNFITSVIETHACYLSVIYIKIYFLTVNGVSKYV